MASYRGDPKETQCRVGLSVMMMAAPHSKVFLELLLVHGLKLRMGYLRYDTMPTLGELPFGVGLLKVVSFSDDTY